MRIDLVVVTIGTIALRCALCIAAPVPVLAQNDPFQGAARLEQLEILLRFPTEGRYSAEKHVYWHPLSKAEFDTSLAHAQRLRRECRVAETAGEAEWLAMQESLLARLPTALTWQRTDREEHTFSTEDVFLAGENHRIIERGTNRQGLRYEWIMEKLGDQLVQRSNFEGERPQTHRATIERLADASCGYVLSALQLMRQGEILIEMAREQGAVHESEDGIVMDVSLRKASNWNRFESWAYPANGIMEIPGMAHATFVPLTDHGRRFTVEWKDCSGSLVMKTQIVWIGPDRGPRSVVQSCWAPGTDACTWEFAANILPVRNPDPERYVPWTPTPGEQIIDQRFGEGIAYCAESDGRTPSDAVVAAEADHRIREHGAREPVVVEVDPARGGTAVHTTPRSDRMTRYLVWGAAAGVSVLLLLRLLRRA